MSLPLASPLRAGERSWRKDLGAHGIVHVAPGPHRPKQQRDMLM